MSVRELLAEESWAVAPLVLGWTLRYVTPEGSVSLQITEVEAYAGELDPASHAYRGMTQRNRVMFGPAGHLYTYRSHGLHWCCNLVTGRDGHASAVLLRAGRVVEGIDLARHRRGEHVALDKLARGPGCLTRAIGITGADDGTDLLAGGPLGLCPGREIDPGSLSRGPRVGVSKAADVEGRFWLRGEPSVSAYRRSPRAPRL